MLYRTLGLKQKRVHVHNFTSVHCNASESTRRAAARVFEPRRKSCSLLRMRAAEVPTYVRD